MQIFRFDSSVSRKITQFSSTGVKISPIMRTDGKLQAGCIHFAAHSVLGFHPAVVKQLFLVVAGSGWVRSKTTEKVPIMSGQAVFWEAGENHESGSETGMTVIVIEGPGVDPSLLMPANK
ncbi:cupin [Paenactinomyces guangxiensis]|uniref:Cupin n=1 Tax=Paenactinomyces guangxiensis TaxID=1490290 RepID=A0A7W1WP68_9BACL|nr:cupin [Paenactinomyces guangxiensis]MBA4493393.1 cupin [Paenactinomyces guangxiensis]MBH8590483.1 cupin [Paenactinomyces guangxiensis]